MKIISYKTIERCMKSIEKKNLNNTGKSISFGSMKCDSILCIRADSNEVEVSDNWKSELISKYLSV